MNLFEYGQRDGSGAGRRGGWFDLGRPVGWEQPNDPEDVIKVETVMGNAGHFDLKGFDGPTGYVGSVLDKGIRDFQGRNGLEVDGIINPGGPTITTARKHLGDLLDVYTPPSARQVEDHHARVQRGEEGLLVTRPPSPTLRPVPDLPEVSGDTFAMNRRSADYLRRNGTDGEHPRWTALDVVERGPAGVARARDLVEQLREQAPDRADGYASAILANLPDDQQRRAFLGGDPPAPRPLGILAAEAPDRANEAATEGEVEDEENPQQVAQAGLVLKAGKVLIDEGAKIFAKEAGKAAAGVAGGVAIGSVTGDTPQDQRPDGTTGEKGTRDALPEGVMKEIMRPFENRRGDAHTQKGNDIVAETCKEVLGQEFPELSGSIDHIGGATKDGGKDVYQGEKHLPGPKTPEDKHGRLGGNYPDLTWERNGNEDDRAHANTVSTLKDGTTPTAGERRQLAELIGKVGEDLVTAIPKLRPGMDEDEYRTMVRDKCREIFGKWKNHKPGKTDPGGDGKEGGASN
ncbi:MAG: peptidoglycan-binding protein [Alphaproteobacteria bacterium]